eukprot:5017783-Amphidinium_carterae.1
MSPSRCPTRYGENLGTNALAISAMANILFGTPTLRLWRVPLTSRPALRQSLATPPTGCPYWPQPRAEHKTGMAKHHTSPLVRQAITFPSKQLIGVPCAFTFNAV